MNKNQKGFAYILVTIIIGIIAVVGYLVINQSKPQPSSPSLSPTPISDVTANWKTFKSDLYSFEIKLPIDWKEIEHSSSFENYFPFQSMDLSSFSINVDENKFSSLEKYISDRDKKDRTSWEGKPSRKVNETKETSVGQHTAIERKESWFAAGFDAVVTYVSVDGKVFTFTVWSGEKDLSKSEAMKNYYLILSTFKLLDKNLIATPIQAISNAKLVSTSGWLDTSNASETSFVVSYPPEYSFFSSGDAVNFRHSQNPENVSGFGIRRVGDPQTYKPTQIYSGGSRREWWIRTSYDDSHSRPTNLLFVEKLMGKINGLEVWEGNTLRVILVANGNKLYMVDADTQIIDLQTLETVISTLKFD